MPTDSRHPQPRTRRRHRLAGLVAGSAVIVASGIAAAPAHAADSAPTVPTDATCVGDFGPQPCTHVHDSVQWSVVNGSAGMPTVTAVGLTAPSQLVPDGTAIGDPSRSGGTTAPTHAWTLTVPAGATEIVLSEELFQLTPDRPASLPSISLTGPTGTRAITDDTFNKTLTWANPPAGTYTAEVDTQADGNYDFNAYSAVVAPGAGDPEAQFSAQAAPDTASGDPDANTAVTAAWDNLLANTTYYGTVSYSGTDAVTAVQIQTGNGYGFQEVARPQLEGAGTVGSTLSIDNGLWVPADDGDPSDPHPVFTGTFDPTFTYQWMRDYQPIVGATSATYTVTPADAGHDIAGFITASQRMFSDYQDIAGDVAVAKGAAYATSPPTITGSARIGKALTAHPGTWSVPGLTFDYQWTANGYPIADATAPTLTLIPGLAGKAIGVTVTNDTEGYTSATAKSATVKALATPTVKLKLAEKRTYTKVHGKRTVVRHVVATVTVTAVVPVSGKVRVTIGGVNRTLTLRNGRASLTVVHAKAGMVRGRAAYAGSGTVAAATATATIKLR